MRLERNSSLPEVSLPGWMVIEPRTRAVPTHLMVTPWPQPPGTSHGGVHHEKDERATAGKRIPLRLLHPELSSERQSEEERASKTPLSRAASLMEY